MLRIVCEATCLPPTNVPVGCCSILASLQPCSGHCAGQGSVLIVDLDEVAARCRGLRWVDEVSAHRCSMSQKEEEGNEKKPLTETFYIIMGCMRQIVTLFIQFLYLQEK